MKRWIVAAFCAVLIQMARMPFAFAITSLEGA